MKDLKLNSIQDLKKEGKSFYWASFFLPKNTKRNAGILYSICRYFDDRADKEKNNQAKFLNQSIEEIKTIKSIWPNPINAHTYIYLENKNENITLEICDINGRTITRSRIHKNKIHLYSLLTRKMKRGIYILKTIKENGAIDAKRFVF